MGRWKDKAEKKRFFGRVSRRDRQGRSAREFLEQAEGSGLSVDPGTGTLLIGSGPVSDAYLRYRRRTSDAQIPETQTWKRHQAERRELFEQMLSGEKGGFYTRPNERGGTDLMWEGYDYKGRYSTHPFLIATSARSNARLSDFDGPGGGFLDPNLRYDMLTERFADFYRLVMGKTSVLAPSSDEQSAVDFAGQLQEAGQMVKQGED